MAAGMLLYRWAAGAALLTLFACGGGDTSGGGDTRREESIVQVAQADGNPDPNVPPPMPQPLSLPSGSMEPGASVGYLPGTWAVSPSGQFTYAIPLDVPQGRAGMQPNLSLNYSSGSGNGVLGVGWSVSGLSTISRCGKSLSSEGIVDGVDYSDFGTDIEASVDHFCLDGKKLVAINGQYGATGTEYRTEKDTYAQVFSQGTGSLGPDSFTVNTRDGKIRVYVAVTSPHWGPVGTPPGSQSVPGQTLGQSLDVIEKVPSRWLLSSESDRSGNSVGYSYTIVDDGNGGQELLPSRIDYTRHAPEPISYRHVDFNYAPRQDVDFAWQSGVRTTQSKRLKSIVMYAPNPSTTMAVWLYQFDYRVSSKKNEDVADPSLLASVQKCAIKDGNLATLGGCLWKKSFDWYEETAPQFTTHNIDTTSLVTTQGVNGIGVNDISTHPVVQTLDVDGDGTDDILFQAGDTLGGSFLNGKPNAQAVLYTSRVVAPPPLGAPFSLLGYKFHSDANGGTFTSDVDLAKTYPVDIDGDGTSEVFLGHNIDDFGVSCESKVVHWGANSFTDTKTWPAYSCSTAPVHRFLDLDGDNRLDHIETSSFNQTLPNSTATFLAYMPWQISMNLGGTFGTPFTSNTNWDATVDRLATLISDFDGDGRAEVYNDAGNFILSLAMTGNRKFAMLDANAGWGVTLDGGTLPALTLKTAARPDANIISGDFNGDGLLDAFYLTEGDDNFVYLPPGHDCVSHMRWNTGNGFTKEATWTNRFIDACSKKKDFLGSPYQSYRVVDLNRDGLDDIVAFDASQNPPQVLLMFSRHMSGSNSTGFDFDVKPLSGNTPLWLQWLGNTGDTFPTSKVGDFNGDGFVDISGVEVPGPNSVVTSPTLVVLTQTPQFSNRLKSVSDEDTLWPRETITYSTDLSDKPEARDSCAYPLHCVTRGMIVVREVASRDHLVDPVDPNQNVRTQYYSYEDPVNDMRGRGFQGFRKVRVWDPARPMERVTTYANHQQWPTSVYPFALRPVEVTTVVPLSTLKGWPLARGFDTVNARVTQTKYTNQSKILNGGKTYDDLPNTWSSSEWEQKVTIDWGTVDPDPSNPTSEHIFGISKPARLLRSLDGYTKFDDFGNSIERKTSVSSSTDAGRSRLEMAYYDNLTSNWLVGLKRWDKVTLDEPNNVDQPSITRAMDYDYDVATGQLKTVYQEKSNADPSLRTTTTLTYDAVYGLVTDVATQAMDSTGAVTSREIRHEYQPTWPNQPDERVFLSQVWRPFTPLAYRPSVWVAFHPAYGVVEAMMDVNGVQTSMSYDDLGREVTASPLGQSQKKTSYAGRADSYGGLNGIVVSSSVDGAKSIVYRDALGREIKSSENKFDGNFAEVDTSYDILGRSNMHSRPHLSQIASPQTFFVYDPLDRLLKTTLPNAATVVSSYTFLQTQTTDEDQHQSTVLHDLTGRVVVSSSVVAGASLKTTYRYAPSGKIDLVIDPAGNKTSTHYDILGRATHKQDPDAGTTDLFYDGFSELTAETHLETAETTKYYLDALGRLYDTADPDGGHTKLGWDTAVNGIGKLAGTHSPDNVDTAVGYDFAGRPSTNVQTVGGQSYKSEVHYDPQGHISELLYPSISQNNVPAITVQYKYTPENYLYEIGYVALGQAYQMLEHIAARNLDDGLLKSQFGTLLNAARTYEPTTGRLSSTAVTKGLNSPVFNLGYTYYPSGLVWTRTDAVQSRVETFVFDEAERLSDWKNQYVGNSVNTHYMYDPTGNLTDVTNGAGYTEHNDYPSAGNTHPHALTKQTFNGGATADYQYDTYGRQNAASGYGHDLAHGGARKIPKYSRFDLPQTLTMNGNPSTFLYDALGERVVKTTPVGTTTYVGKLYEHRTEIGQPQHVFHIYGPEGALADITQNTTSSSKVVNYIATDALGSVGAVVSPVGVVSSLAYFEPFGKRINPDGSEFAIGTVGAVKNGFTGHEHDYESGLINMGGRMYDAAIRRFLTPDPIVSNPRFGQSWNPYSYVNNSPLNATDPTGYEPHWECGPFPCYLVDDGKGSDVGPGGVPVKPGDWGNLAQGAAFGGGLAEGWNYDPKAPVAGASGSAGPAHSDGTNYESPTGAVPQPNGEEGGKGESWRDSPFVEGVGCFIGGLGLGITPFGGLAHGIATSTGAIGRGTRAQQIGLGIGEIVGGVVEVVGGAGGAFGGTLLSGTGFGALIGVPAIVGSAALVTSGSANVASGITNLLMAKRYHENGDRVGDGREPRQTKTGANSKDKQIVDDAARAAGITDRRGFGDYVEELKRASQKGGRDNFSWDDLMDIAAEFLNHGGQ